MAGTTNIKQVAQLAGVSLGTVSNVLNQPERVAEATRKRVVDAIAKLGYVRNDSARQLRAGSSRQIAIVVLDVANPFFADVVRGVESAAEEHGVMVVVCNSDEDAGRERRHLDLLEEQRIRGVLITPVDDGRNSRVEQLMKHGVPVVLVDRGSGWRNRCSAAFCANDLLALGVLQEMTRRGLRVPEDIAIVGYDDIEFAAAAAVPLSSVRQPREQLDRTAAQLLLEETEPNSHHQHRHVVFQPELVVRESSDKPAAVRRSIAKARRG